MRWTRWTAGIAVAAAVGGVAYITSCAPAKPAGMTQEQKIARGRVLSWASGCNDCHTPGGLYGMPDTTRMLSGSELGWRGPWGVSYPRNLTPHETGLATWSEDDIITAFRQGHRPDGSPLLPPMPWAAYAHMSDEDAHALAAFIKSLPPIEHHNLRQLHPDEAAVGPELVVPPPPAWDVPPPPPAAGS